MVKPLLHLLLGLLISSFCFAQGRTINGKVTAKSDGAPLPGVSVMVKGIAAGTQTDAKGNFELEIPASAKILNVSYLGYQTQEVVITSGMIAIVLQDNSQSLNEVIVTGYGTQNEREVAGSVATIKAEQINYVPIASFDQALQGRAAGLLVQASSGQPGAAASVVVRGRGSILGSTNPLYIMDGIEITAADFATINTQDIAAVNILKDALATAQYGSRGANGVIVITTKQGHAGRPIVRYDAQFGRSTAPDSKVTLMNSTQKLDYELANGNPNGWTASDVATLKQVNTDWKDVIFKTGITKSHNLSVSGGVDKTKYFVSGSLYDQSGTVLTTRLKRYNGRINLSSGTQDFDFGLNSTYGYSNFTNTSEANTVNASPLNAIRWINPYLTPYNPDGSYTKSITGQPNPLPNLIENSNLRGQLKLVGNVYAIYHVPVVKGLYAKVNGGVDYTSNEITVFNSPLSTVGSALPGGRGSLTRGYGKLTRYTLTSSVGYSKDVSEDHHISATIFNEIVSANSNSFQFTGYGLGGAFENESGITPGTATNNFIPVVSGGGGADPMNSSALLGPNALLSYFANLKYNYKERYFIESYLRRDGSSRFGSDRRYANFGSVGVSWVASNEGFFAPVKNIFSDFKLKASYGSAGNQPVTADFLPRELYGRAVYNGVSGLVQSQLDNPELQWERRTTFNTGLEFTAWNGRIGGSFDYYNALTSNLLLNQQLSRTTGRTSVISNSGKLRNSGIEASLNIDVLKAKDFDWNVFANFTYNKSKIVELLPGQNEIVDGIYVNRVGEKLNQLYLVRYVGVNPANGKSIYLNKNGNTTETYSSNDRVLVGSAETPYFGGFGSSISYKGFEASAFFSFVKGNKIFNYDRSNVEYPYAADNLSADLLREWRTPGQVTDIPSPNGNFIAETTRFVENGDFLRLRNATISYSLPKTWLSSVKINSLRFFVQGQNLITWTKFRGFDPEYATGNLIGAQYPAMRTITAGLNIAL
ncbi:TonB-dependent receptor [Mucilaginibacter sp. CSA2-8R]|uniref:SusC/RagA family TonB-linked outer membrane protein n=1 Tax=Mucilaginibacter sp. CSA2-8R TaxID=3141542 RepID=UPI00315CC7A0